MAGEIQIMIPQYGELNRIYSDFIVSHTFLLNTVIAATASENGEKAKPPNVKSITKGRAVLNGEKNEQSRTEAQADRTTTEDDTEKQDINAEAKEDTDTKTEEKPKTTIWDWLYLVVVGGFCVYAIIIGLKVAIKMHRAAKGK